MSETVVLPKGAVIEWWVEKKWVGDKQVDVQRHQIMKPKCANAGQLEHAGQCSCAPDPKSPEVIAYREEQAKLGKSKPVLSMRPNYLGKARANHRAGKQKQLTQSAKVIGSDSPKADPQPKHPRKRRATKRRATKQTQVRKRR